MKTIICSKSKECLEMMKNTYDSFSIPCYHSEYHEKGSDPSTCNTVCVHFNDAKCINIRKIKLEELMKLNVDTNEMNLVLL